MTGFFIIQQEPDLFFIVIISLLNKKHVTLHTQILGVHAKN